MPAHAALEAFLSAQLEPLRGRFREVNIRLTSPEGIEVVPGEALLNPATLRETIARFGERIGTNSQRIAGVHWLGQLGYAVLPPIEMAMTRAGIGLDAGLANLGIVQPNGQPADILIRDRSGTVVLPERYTGDLPLDRRYFTYPSVSRLIVSGESTPTKQRAALSAHAELLIAPGDEPDLIWVMRTLRETYNVCYLLVEGGPNVNGGLFSAGLVDEICWTLGPKIIGGGESLTLVNGPTFPLPVPLTLRSAYLHEDEFFMRYRVRRD